MARTFQPRGQQQGFLTIVTYFICSPTIVGPLMVDQNTVDNMEDLERKLSVQHEGWVKKGGAWAPDDCKALRKV